MGDIADFVLEGGMCQECGEIIDDPMGFPTSCAGCRIEDQQSSPDQITIDLEKTVFCTFKGCERKFKEQAHMYQHLKDYHGRKFNA